MGLAFQNNGFDKLVAVPADHVQNGIVFFFVAVGRDENIVVGDCQTLGVMSTQVSGRPSLSMDRVDFMPGMT